jgi:hypothetical protein
MAWHGMALSKSLLQLCCWLLPQQAQLFACCSQVVGKVMNAP